MLVVLFLCVGVLGKDRLWSVDKELLLENSEDVWFESLSEQELNEHWSFDDGELLSSKTAKLQQLEVTILLSVKLVGFGGRSHRSFSISEAQLLNYLPAAVLGSHVHLLHPEHGQGNTLPFKTKFVFQVSKTSPSLSRDITKSIADQVANHLDVIGKHRPEQLEELEPISILTSSVDALVAEDFRKHGLSYTIYLLNPSRPAGGLQYYYAQPPDSHETIFPHPECGMMGWVGTDRYVWIDLSAGPVTFGPQTHGSGLVTDLSIPSVDRVFHTPHVGGKLNVKANTHAFMAEVAAFVGHTASLLVTPPVHRFPIPYARHTIVNLMLISAGNQLDPLVIDKQKVADQRWERVLGQLQRLALAGQTVAVNVSRVSSGECPLCVAALSHSRKPHTSNVLADGLRTQVHEYLHSKELREWLQKFEMESWGLKDYLVEDYRQQNQGAGSVRVLNAFVYDVDSSDILLLDRFHQAVSFRDMVVAVQTNAQAALVDFQCNGVAMTMDPSDPARAVLGALLETGWGVARTHDVWSHHRSTVEQNYLWSIGDTPFGPFSLSTRLSFAQRDAAARAILYSSLNHTLAELQHLLSHFQTPKKELDQVFTAGEHLHFIRRWNVLSFKLERTEHFLSLNNFNQSLYYIRSALHDLGAIHKLVEQVQAVVRPVIQCQQVAAASLPVFALAELLLLLSIVTIACVLACCTHTPVHKALHWMLGSCRGRSRRKLSKLI